MNQSIMQNIQDNYYSSFANLWTNLITINGIIIGAYSIIFSFNAENLNKASYIIFSIALLFTLISILLLSYNLKLLRSHLSALLDVKENVHTEKDIDRYVSKEILRAKKIRYFEKFSEFTLFFNIIWIIITVWITINSINSINSISKCPE